MAAIEGVILRFSKDERNGLADLVNTVHWPSLTMLREPQHDTAPLSPRNDKLGFVRLFGSDGTREQTDRKSGPGGTGFYKAIHLLKGDSHFLANFAQGFAFQFQLCSLFHLALVQAFALFAQMVYFVTIVHKLKL